MYLISLLYLFCISSFEKSIQTPKHHRCRNTECLRYQFFYKKSRGPSRYVVVNAIVIYIYRKDHIYWFFCVWKFHHSIRCVRGTKHQAGDIQVTYSDIQSDIQVTYSWIICLTFCVVDTSNGATEFSNTKKSISIILKM